MIDWERKQEAIEQLHPIKTEFAARGWLPATSGNLSLLLDRASLTYIITTSGRDKSQRTAHDFMLMSEGIPMNTSLKPSAEASIHEAIYRSTDSTAVFHIHSVATTIISDWDYPLGFVPLARFELLKALNIWEENAVVQLPITDNDAHVPTIAQRIPQLINPRVPGILLRNHGLYAWGKTVFECKRHVEAFDMMCECRYRQHIAGRASH